MFLRRAFQKSFFCFCLVLISSISFSQSRNKGVFYNYQTTIGLEVGKYYPHGQLKNQLLPGTYGRFFWAIPLQPSSRFRFEFCASVLFSRSTGINYYKGHDTLIQYKTGPIFSGTYEWTSAHRITNGLCFLIHGGGGVCMMSSPTKLNSSDTASKSIDSVTAKLLAGGSLRWGITKKRALSLHLTYNKCFFDLDRRFTPKLGGEYFTLGLSFSGY